MKQEKKTGKWIASIPGLFFFLMAIGLMVLADQSIARASTVVLQWDTSTDPNITGYKVYYQADSSAQPFQGTGASQGSSPLDVQNLTTTTISGLDPAHAYYFAVVAYNAAGVESSYSNVVTVPELTPPTVSLTSPAKNATVSGTVSVTATASDNVGVSKVEFYVNGLLKATDTSSPYVYSWNTSGLSAGSYTLLAIAYDAAGNTSQSSVAVNVSASSSTTTGSSVPGDVNGDGIVDLQDALLALKIASGSVQPTAAQLRGGDIAPIVNGISQPNGVIDLGDVIAILGIVTGTTTL